ncbi:MAG: hypothetical protein K2N63_02915 [Lachnospiraceae bacterium]|nr:hypothetical protein [Lachnospiraceae bacterium]
MGKSGIRILKTEGNDMERKKAATFLGRLGGLDASIIEEAREENLHWFKKRRRVKFATAAAFVVLCLTVGGGIAATAALGVKIFDIKSGKDDSSYALGYVIRYRPQEVFGGQADEVREAIQKQYKEYSPFSSRTPNFWNRTFDNWESALSFLGIDFMEAPVNRLTPSLVDLAVIGTKEGEFQLVILTGRYYTAQYNISVAAEIYVGDSGEEVEEGHSVTTVSEAEFYSEPYVTRNGIPCTLVDTVVFEGDASEVAEGYLVKDGIFYSVSYAPRQQNDEAGENRMEIVKGLLEEIAAK